MNTKPCPRCGAAGTSPCVTASGRPAKAWHKVRTLVTRSPRELEEAVLAATSTAPWLSEIEAPAISAAAVLARSIDDAVWKAELEAQRSQTALFEDHTTPTLADDTGSLGYPIQVLIQILDRLGLTPAGRHSLNLDDEEVAADDLARVLEFHA